MKLFPRTVSLFAALFLSAVTSYGAGIASIVPGQLIVKYKDGVIRTRGSMNAIYHKVGAEKVQFQTGILKNFEVLTLSQSANALSAMQVLETDPSVEYVQPNVAFDIPEIREFGRIASGELEGQENPIEGIPCIPGIIEPPNCDPNIKLPCIFPGFPPGCDDGSGGGGGAPKRPDVAPAPVEGEPVEDPDFAALWGMRKIGAPEAWKITKGSKEIVVGVIDTGIDYNHEDLGLNVWRSAADKTVGYDFVHNDALPFDDNGHGTHVSGTIGGVGMNGKGVVGVNHRVSIMGLKFLTGKGQGDLMAAAKAIAFGVEKGAKILSNSWGGKLPIPGLDKPIRDAVTAAEKAGVLFVAAAGNEGANNDNSSEASIPAAYEHENVLAVAATDQDDKITYYSNFGKKSVDLAAPGGLPCKKEEAPCKDNRGVHSSIPGGKYQEYAGTSMACPHVAGAAALIWSKYPQLTYQQVKTALMGSVDKLAGLETKTVTGGRLNVYKALRSLE